MILGKIHLYPTEVTFDLLDAGGVVHHPNYLILCERARCQAIQEAGYPFQEMLGAGIATAIREAQCDYLRPLKMGQKIVILTETEEAQRSFLKIRQRIYLDDSKTAQELKLNESSSFFIPKETNEFGPYFKQIIFQLQVKLVCIQLKSFQATRLPENLKTALKIS